MNGMRPTKSVEWKPGQGLDMEEKVRQLPYRPVDPTCRVDGRFVVAVPEVDRFWSKVDRDPDCWLWLGLRNAYGYGRFFIPGGERLAHRYAYEFEVGPIPEGLTLDHLCETPACVRPDHLEPVTNAENLRRRHARRRLLNGVTR